MTKNGCRPQDGVVSKCWREGQISRGPFTGNQTLFPVGEQRRLTSDGKMLSSGGMYWGAYWDRTPNKFDNDYFKLFIGERFEGKDVCCGRKYGNRCSKLWYTWMES